MDRCSVCGIELDEEGSHCEDCGEGPMCLDCTDEHACSVDHVQDATDNFDTTFDTPTEIEPDTDVDFDVLVDDL